MAQSAEKDGIAAKDETRAVMELSRLQVLQQAASQAYLKDRKPSQEELQAEYDLQVGQISKTQYRASHILVPTQARSAEDHRPSWARARPSQTWPSAIPPMPAARIAAATWTGSRPKA